VNRHQFSHPPDLYRPSCHAEPVLTQAFGAGTALIMVTALAACSGPPAGSRAAAAVVPPAVAVAPPAVAVALPTAATVAAPPMVVDAAARVGPPPLGPVTAGQRPPQVVVLAFDDSQNAVSGSGGQYAMFDYWRHVARDYDARMTFFVLGTNLLTSQTLHTYEAPQLGPANPGMGLAVPHALPLPGETQTDAIRHELINMKRAHAEGNEIGTHFMGHICAGSKGSVGSFSAANWEQELEQFYKAVDDANETNHLDPAVDLGFKGEDVVGSRTPCLEGNFHNLYPVAAKHGFTYDTSPTPQIRWPHRGASNTGPTDMWVFPLATLPLYGSGHDELDMDWNICAFHDSGCIPHSAPKASSDKWGQQALDTYRAYFEKAYTGDRAPLYIGDHFEMWHNGTYTKALASFAKETCSKPEVRCVSYREVADWLNRTPAAQLESWRNGDFPHYTDPNPPPYGKPVADVLMPEPWVAKEQ